MLFGMMRIAEGGEDGLRYIHARPICALVALGADAPIDAPAVAAEPEGASIAYLPSPIPWYELEGPCASAGHWQEAEQVLRAHRSHIEVSLAAGALDPVAAHMALTCAVARACARPEAVGVLWPAGQVVHPAARFVADSQSMTHERLPLHLFVDFRLRRVRDGYCSCTTTGMAAFRHLEIEIHPGHADPKVVLARARSLAQRLIDRGPSVADGATVPLDTGADVTLRRGVSRYRPGQEVWLVDA